MAAKIKPGGMHFQGLARNEAGATNRQATFRGFAVARKEMLGHDELQDGVAEKFEALVIEMFFLSFVRNARMSQGLDEQTDITESITDALFQGMHVSLGRTAR